MCPCQKHSSKQVSCSNKDSIHFRRLHPNSLCYPGTICFSYNTDPQLSDRPSNSYNSNHQNFKWSLFKSHNQILNSFAVWNLKEYCKLCTSSFKRHSLPKPGHLGIAFTTSLLYILHLTGRRELPPSSLITVPFSGGMCDSEHTVNPGEGTEGDSQKKQKGIL